MEWKKISAYHMSDKGLIFQNTRKIVFKNIAKNPNNPTGKWAKDLNRCFSKDMQMTRFGDLPGG